MSRKAILSVSGGVSHHLHPTFFQVFPQRYRVKGQHKIYMICGSKRFARSALTALAASILCCALMQPAAKAEVTHIPSPFVPWLQAQGLTIQKETVVQEKSTVGRSGTQSLSTNRAQPLPLISSADEIDLLLARMAEPEEKTQTPLEKSYSKRAGVSQNNFVLSMGDKIEVVFTGQRTDREIYTVNADGLLLVKDLPPVPAAGLKIEDVKKSLKAYAAHLHNTEVFISLYDIEQIDVYVAGHVKEPGQKTMTVFHNVLDVLNMAGGIEKTGSLRRIKIIRGEDTINIDLYDLLVNYNLKADYRLRSGDKIIVAPIGQTAAIAGDIVRPAIYELPAGKKHIGQSELMRYGAGLIKPGDNRLIKFSLTKDGEETVSELSAKGKNKFEAGALLLVQSGKAKRTGFVSLSGHTRHPGLHPLHEDRATLADLLGKDGYFGPDIYPLFGVITRKDKEHMTTKYLPFPPLQVIQGSFDQKLHDNDKIRLFSNKEIQAVLAKLSADEDNPEAAMVLTELDAEKPAPESLRDKKDDAENDSRALLNALLKDHVLMSFLHEHLIYIRGAVRKPGPYPIVPATALSDILAVAGGLARHANIQNIELTSALSGAGHQNAGRSGKRRTRINLRDTQAETVILEPGDTLRVNQSHPAIEDKSVVIMGALNYPGTYDLLPGDKLSDLLRRAGGLTTHAYPDGAIFSRKSARKAEQERFRNVAYDLERSVALAIKDSEKSPDMNQINMARQLAAELRNVQAVGRITVEADPAMLALEPDLDILLQPGDMLYIPQRPLTVRVSGEVLSPAELQFRKDKKPKEYIDQAGSYTHNADQDRVFVVMPDGSAKPLKISYWQNDPVFIPPGATIVVPRDPKPFSFIESARDISQILSNLAVTGIFLDDISDND